MPAVIQCRLLGPLEVTVDGHPAPAELLWARNVALLLYLARSGTRGRTREHLAGLLWPEKDDALAKKSLNQALYVVRRYLPRGSLSTSAGSLRLAPGSVDLDIDRFDACAAKEDWAGAAGLVEGAFLDGFLIPEATGFENWLTAERDAWRQRGVQALSRHGAAELDRGRLDAGVAFARRALALDRHSDAAVRVLMLGLALSGDRAAALDAFESFVATLADEVGTEPEAETRALAEQVRRLKVWRGKETGSERGVESRRAPLIGRERELERLLAAWAEVRATRRPGALIISGDPGAGKSRLAEELAARARLAGALTSLVRLVPGDEAVPWAGLAALAGAGLGEAPGLAGASPEALAGIAARAPQWLERFPGVRGASPLAPSPAFSEVLRAVSEERPVLLVADDAEYLDADSLHALAALARDLPVAPVGVVLTVPAHPGSGELDRFRARVGRDVPGATLALAPLGAAELLELCRWAFPGYPPDQLDRVARRVGADSAGYPLSAVELIHAVHSGTAEAWPTPHRTYQDTPPGPVSGAFVAAVRVNFRTLAEPEQMILRAAALLGDRVPAATLGRAVGLDGPALDAALDDLEWKRWLVVEPRGYGFLSRMYRQTVATELTPDGQRRRILDAAKGAPAS
ncbi:MAG TPA: AAA family ATPase [Gemmatimonadales bacterium]|nr:AAA family ATPase [Gemmatimonadales bacterium]